MGSIFLQYPDLAYHAVTGEVLDRIREGNTKNTLEGKPHVRDFLTKKNTKESIGKSLMWQSSIRGDGH